MAPRAGQSFEQITGGDNLRADAGTPSRLRLLIIGGTRFIGPHVVRRLAERGHEVTVFHRGDTPGELPPSVRHIHGDRIDLPAFRGEFERLAPEVVVHMIAFTERDAVALTQAFAGIARRVVVISSMDVYRAYDGLRRMYDGPPDAVPLTEDAPLRSNLHPYRSKAKDENDFAYGYEKILVERAMMVEARVPGTVLRLPAVYGPGDYQHRAFGYVRRMDEGRPAILLDEGQMRWRWTRGYVENVAAAIALAATDPRASGRIYNLGERQALTEAEWVRALGHAAGWAGRVVGVPAQQLPLHLREDLDWTHHLVADTGRMREQLGYSEPVPLEEALARTVAWERVHPPAKIEPEQFDYAAEDAALAGVPGFPR